MLLHAQCTLLHLVAGRRGPAPWGRQSICYIHLAHPNIPASSLHVLCTHYFTQCNLNEIFVILYWRLFTFSRATYNIHHQLYLNMYLFCMFQHDHINILLVIVVWICKLCLMSEAITICACTEITQCHFWHLAFITSMAARILYRYYIHLNKSLICSESLK